MFDSFLLTTQDIYIIVIWETRSVVNPHSMNLASIFVKKIAIQICRLKYCCPFFHTTIDFCSLLPTALVFVQNCFTLLYAGNVNLLQSNCTINETMKHGLYFTNACTLLLYAHLQQCTCLQSMYVNIHKLLTFYVEHIWKLNLTGNTYHISEKNFCSQSYASYILYI